MGQGRYSLPASDGLRDYACVTATHPVQGSISDRCQATPNGSTQCHLRISRRGGVLHSPGFAKDAYPVLVSNLDQRRIIISTLAEKVDEARQFAAIGKRRRHHGAIEI